MGLPGSCINRGQNTYPIPGEDNMCTALSLQTAAHYFGRNLDLDRSYGEEVCVLPRRFPLTFRSRMHWDTHYAIIGMATVAEGIPLFYDGANEFGLAMAGLNFPGNAWYGPEREGKDNVAPFELIPWVLGQCKNLGEAKQLLSRLNLTDIPFSDQLPQAPLHWMISHREGSVVVEAMADGLHVHENPAGVLTNNPPFPYQMANLWQYRHLRPDNGGVDREENQPYEDYCQGLGAVGLPGDVSSMSRFVQMVFGREHSICPEEEAASVGQFFHLLSSVEMIRGLCKTDEGTWDTTGYSACINLDQGRYYYTTYENRRITCVDLYKTDWEGDTLSCFPLRREESIFYQNR